MAADDLSTPLGANRSGRTSTVRARSQSPLLVAILAALLVVPILWITLVEDPFGGEPAAVVAISDPPAKDGDAAPPPASAKDATAGQTVTIIDGKSGARTQVAVSGGEGQPPANSAPPLDARLAEVSRHGPIPRIGPGGVRPLDVYSRADPSAAARKEPQIALVIGGLGIGAGATSEAIAKLPAAVTLAFAPYGADLADWIQRARGAGHELLLQVPMEPFDFPDNDPGPRTLLSNLSPSQNIDRLHWFLSRFQGYVGVTNLMGGRFTSNEAALAPVLSDLASRGLLYFEDGTSPRSLTHKAASAAKTPFLRADLVVDVKPNWSDIDAALERLERLAADKGFAIGMASALPVSIERIERWAKAAEARGIRIVPLSAVALRSKQS